MGKFHLALKLKALRIELSENLVLIFLSAQFSQFNVSITVRKTNGLLMEVICHCVQKEERLK